MRSSLCLVACALLLSACANDSANMRIGDEQSYDSLADQRAAAREVAVAPTLPSGAIATGQITASRCHRYAVDKPPTNADVLADLMASAYGKGADGIYGVKIETNTAGALFKNCWHTLVGTATMYRVGAS